MLVPQLSQDNFAGHQNQKKVCILGSTGSIGCATIDVVKLFPDQFQVVGLACGSNEELLLKQANELNCAKLAIAQETSATRDPRIIFNGSNSARDLVEAVGADIVVSAITGFAGLDSTLMGIKKSCRVALANKESLVCGGHLIKEALENNPEAELLPVDSEHSAIFQALNGEHIDSVENLVITASGGPFREKSLTELEQVSVSDALKHPTWNMGANITVDSASLMNKALEVIEAHWLFGLTEQQIDVLVHPQSIIHSLVNFKDGSNIAQLSIPDMKGPIVYALRYPELRKGPVTEMLDLTKLKSLDFYELDSKKFPAIDLARHCLRVGGTASLVFNTANEVARGAFLNSGCSFLDIMKIVEWSLENIEIKAAGNLEDLQELDLYVRRVLTDKFL